LEFENDLWSLMGEMITPFGRLVILDFIGETDYLEP